MPGGALTGWEPLHSNTTLIIKHIAPIETAKCRRGGKGKMRNFGMNKNIILDCTWDKLGGGLRTCQGSCHRCQKSIPIFHSRRAWLLCHKIARRFRRSKVSSYLSFTTSPTTQTPVPGVVSPISRGPVWISREARKTFPRSHPKLQCAPSRVAVVLPYPPARCRAPLSGKGIGPSGKIPVETTMKFRKVKNTPYSGRAQKLKLIIENIMKQFASA